MSNVHILIVNRRKNRRRSEFSNFDKAVEEAKKMLKVYPGLTSVKILNYGEIGISVTVEKAK